MFALRGLVPTQAIFFVFKPIVTSCEADLRNY